jgi:mRNA interferase HigB
VHVIARKALAEFWARHREAKAPLTAWYKLMRGAQFTDLTSLRRTFGSADYVPPYTVFDVGGNKYRIVAAIHYNRRKLYIRHVLTHADYDRWSTAHRRTKR